MTNDISAIGQARPTSLANTAATAPVKAQPEQPKTEVGSPTNRENPKADFEPTITTEEIRENVRQAIKRLNEMMRENSRNLNFSMDETTDRVVITVKNANTGEVVRQIPDATFLRVAHNLENLKGVLHNQSG